MPAEAALDQRLTQMQPRVLIAILTFRRKNSDSVVVGREAISRRCGYNPETISKVTSQLVNHGWLEKIEKGGQSRASEYCVVVPDLGFDPDEETVSELDTVPPQPTLSNPDSVRASQTVSTSGTVPGVGTVPDPGGERCPEWTPA